MPYVKRIVCLANSRKLLGRCIAGREFSENGQFGGWIRPVSNRPTQEVSEEERRYENGQDPRLCDIVNIQMRVHVPHAHQSENHLIDEGHDWVKAGTVTWDQLDAAVAVFPGTLWVDGNSSYNGENDRIPEAQALGLPNSLTLVEPDELVIAVAHEGIRPKRKVRARFSFGAHRYVLVVTDPIVERQYLAKENGEYPIETARLCVSIGEAYQAHCYKLVAAIITP